MKIGDIVLDSNNKEWLVFDIFDDFVTVTDVQTHKLNGVIQISAITSHREKPDNVEYLFLKKREYRLKGIEKYFEVVK